MNYCSTFFLHEIAEELKTKGPCRAKAFTMVTVMFTDFKDFTTVSGKVSAELLVDEIIIVSADLIISCRNTRSKK